MRCLKDLALFATLQLVASGLWVSNKILNWRYGHFLEDNT